MQSHQKLRKGAHHLTKIGGGGEKLKHNCFYGIGRGTRKR